MSSSSSVEIKVEVEVGVEVEVEFRFNLEVEDEVFNLLLSRVGGWVGGWCGEVKNRANLSQVRLKLRLSLAIIRYIKGSLRNKKCKKYKTKQ